LITAPQCPGHASQIRTQTAFPA